MSAMDMDFMVLDASQDDSALPAKPQIHVADTYTYTGSSITANVLGFDPDTMLIEGNVATNAGTYTITVTPMTKWQDGSTDAVYATWCINKAVPAFDLPVVKASEGTALKQIRLPDSFTWINPNQIVTPDETIFGVVYTPEDTTNYLTVEFDLTIKVLVSEDNSDDDSGDDSDDDFWDDSDDDFWDDSEDVSDNTEETQPSTEGTDALNGNMNGTMEEESTQGSLPQQEAETETEPSIPESSKNEEESAQDTPKQPENAEEKTTSVFLLIGSAVLGIVAFIILLVLLFKKRLVSR
jgi:hypothetical protein